MKENRIQRLKVLAETKFLNLYEVTYKNKNNKERTWFIASRKKPEVLKAQYLEGLKEKMDAVLIVAFHEDQKKLVLIRQFRVPLNDYIYEMPAGLIDEGEQIETTVARELKEETGFQLVQIDKKRSRMQTYLSPGMTDESVAMVYCTCKGEVSKDNLEEDEDIEVVLVSREEAEAILQAKEKIDAKAYIMLQTFSQFGEALFQ